jgi:MFS family permease
MWLGQVVSIFGSAMTWFAFTIWAWETSGKATPLALVGFFSTGLSVVLSPVAGALVDRWNRQRVMMFSDLATGMTTVAVLLLYVTDSLQLWHLYVAATFAGAFQAFQLPAYLAAVTMMLPQGTLRPRRGHGLAGPIGGHRVGPAAGSSLVRGDRRRRHHDH